MQKSNPKKPLRPPQKQEKPGEENRMIPRPVFDNPVVKGCGKLANKIAFITGGDSGIGKAVAVLFAKEGADIAIVYLNEDKDAEETKNSIEKYGRKCFLIAGDISKESFCKKAIAKAVKQFGRINILVNNAAVHWESKSLEEISTKQLLKTFETNIFSFFWITKAAIPNMPKGSAIINTTSVTAYRGSSNLIDYASTKSAIVGFTRSLAQNLIEKGIRVNAVAPGPIWTPLIVSTMAPDKVAKHGSDAPMKRAGEPVEVAPSFLFLACDDSTYITGQVLHPNGGEIVNG
ncbi:MAG: oxidoreductase [Chitinophagaceae bacterium]|nr:oxidoreductase [Chitinophagaceae bacterium]